LFRYPSMPANCFTQNSCQIHAVFTPKTLKLCYNRVTAKCCTVSDFALFDKSVGVAYNTINPTCTDKGKPIER